MLLGKGLEKGERKNKKKNQGIGVRRENGNH